ncbi:MAG TPA: ATP-binding protein [Hyphomicrobiaceae bacterium]|nr:ATP-binding protein [Hyphomicrobiaceae bacterium]
MRLLGSDEWHSLSDVLRRGLDTAARRIRQRLPLLLAVVIGGGAVGLIGGLSPWLVVLGAGLALVLAVLVSLEGDDDALQGRAIAQRHAMAEIAGRWRAALDAVPDPVIALDQAGMIVHINPAAREIYALLRPGGQPSLLSRDPIFLQAIDEVLDDGRQRTVEVQERVPIDRRVRVTLTAMADGAAGPDVPRVVIALRDLTEQDRLGRMRADFVANASHELRTPLASLVGFIETLQGRASEDPAARTRFLGIMGQQTARMSRLVDDLLSLSRVEMREHVPPRTAIDLNETIAAAVQALEPVAKASGAALKFTPCDGPAVVLGETDEIVQVLQNLVQNALKYGAPGRPVSVSIRREARGPTSRIAVAVRDDGPGIAPEHLPRLTERFYRVNAKSSREKGGTGLGLAIVKHIINRHRGELRIESELGKGSTFTFLIDEQARRPSAIH